MTEHEIDFHGGQHRHFEALHPPAQGAQRQGHRGAVNLWQRQGALGKDPGAFGQPIGHPRDRPARGGFAADLDPWRGG